MSLTDEEIKQHILEMPNEVLERVQFSVPWQYDPYGSERVDSDGFPLAPTAQKEDTNVTRGKLQTECWNKFHKNPQFNTSTRGLVGRVCGMGFETSSEIWEIQQEIENTELDPRNRLYYYYPKWFGRYKVEGEMFLMFSINFKDGFIETDFIDPGCIGGDATDGTGIVFHPTKAFFPLFYNIRTIQADGTEKIDQVPSIFVARYPDLVRAAQKTGHVKESYQKSSKSVRNIFNPIGGYYRFIVAMEDGLMTRRAISHMRTTLEWLNHYENLKKYEIDHKKSSGSYVWVVTITDPVAYKTWLSMSDEDKRKTAIMSKKTPGSTLMLPYGMDMKAINPNLPRITDQDNDIMQMVTSGLNEPEDVTTGTSRGSYSSIKASRGPMTDRVSDEIAYFDRWFRNDFWGSIFFLKSAVGKFPATFKETVCTGFKKETITVEMPAAPQGKFSEDDDIIETDFSPEGLATPRPAASTPKKPGASSPQAKSVPPTTPPPPIKVKKEVRTPIFQEVDRRPEQLIDISYPVSETTDTEARARAYLGVKHGSLAEGLGIPNADIAKKLGIGGYGRKRQLAAVEKEKYPDLLSSVDQEASQEKKLEPGRVGPKTKGGDGNGKRGK